MSERAGMRTLLAVVMLGAALLLQLPAAATATPPLLSTGKPLADITFIDDAGRSRSLSDLRGTPLILVPMYTRCQATCGRVGVAVRTALLASTLSPDRYRVLFFSFDPEETTETLREFRQRELLPASWIVATATREENIRLMDSIGFTYETARGEFAHPNMIVVTTPQLRVASYLFGTQFRSAQFEEALQVAMGATDWKRIAVQYGFAFLLFGAVLSLLLLIHLLGRRRELRVVEVA